jgi:phosphohistidine phosphatase
MRAMRELLLLRHAKSSWDDPGLADHDRPLAPRGERAAAVMGAYLRGLPAIDAVLCSTARRALETLAGLALGSVPVVVERELYYADDEALAARVSALNGDVRRVLLIGHNPALEDFARRIAIRGEDRSLARLAKGLKTCNLAHFELAIDAWSELEAPRASLASLVRPKHLEREP